MINDKMKFRTVLHALIKTGAMTNKKTTSTARAALHLLTKRKMAPTPENYTAVYHEVMGDTSSQADEQIEATPEERFEENLELIKLVRLLIDSVSTSTDGLAENLDQSNIDIKNSISALEKTEEKQEILNLLSIVNNAADAMMHSIEVTRVELVNTQQSLADVRAELEVTKQHLMLDPLTSARNRFGMDITIGQELSRVRRTHKKLVLAMVDLDHFKTVNDTYGHDAGDEVLQFFSQVAHSVLRESDYMFRYGGEEFLVLLPDTDINGATFLFDRLKQMQAKSPVHFQGHTIHTTFSAGFTELRDDDNDQTLIQRADQGLYQAKQQGRNQAIAV